MMQCSIQHSIDEIAAGQVPDELNMLTDVGRGIGAVIKSGFQSAAVIIAKVRMDHFNNDIAEWKHWSTETFQITIDYMKHLNRIGRMFLLLLGGQEKCCIQHYRALFTLDYDRLYAISGIASLDSADPEKNRESLLKQLLAFLSHYPVSRLKEMKREDVRDAVKVWMGETVEERKVQPALPGFDDALQSMKQLKGSDFTRLVDADKADDSLRVAMGLLGAALQVKKSAEVPDVIKLSRAKAALQAEIREIEEALARTAELSQLTIDS